MLFLAAIISAFWYLRNEEFEREQESVQRDTEIAQQQIRLRLIENQEQLLRIAREIVISAVDAENFSQQAAAFTQERPEVTGLFWVDANRDRQGAYVAPMFALDAGNPQGDLDKSIPLANQITPSETSFMATNTLRQPIYSSAFTNNLGVTVLQLHIPLIDRGNFSGDLIAEYSTESLLRFYVPTEVAQRHTINLIDSRGNTLASTVLKSPGDKSRRASIVYQSPLAPANNGIALAGAGLSHVDRADQQYACSGWWPR